LFHLVLDSHDGRALAPSPKRSESPRETSTLHSGYGLKALDPNWPIREATDIAAQRNVRFLSSCLTCSELT
jgi:hypothetical protein